MKRLLGMVAYTGFARLSVFVSPMITGATSDRKNLDRYRMGKLCYFSFLFFCCSLVRCKCEVVD